MTASAGDRSELAKLASWPSARIGAMSRKGSVALAVVGSGRRGEILSRVPVRPVVVGRSAFTGYQRFSLSYRDIAELLAERGAEVDHVTIYGWVHQFPRRRATPDATVAPCAV